LAHYVFSSFGTSVAVPHPEDTGIDLHCTLTQQVDRRMWPEVYYSIQVKSDDKPWELVSLESVQWFIAHPLPLFYCIVTKKGSRLRVYQASARFHLYVHPPVQTHLELIPGEGTGGVPIEWDGVSTALQLGAPILDFKLSDLDDDGFHAKVKD